MEAIIALAEILFTSVTINSINRVESLIINRWGGDQIRNQLNSIYIRKYQLLKALIIRKTKETLLNPELYLDRLMPTSE